jgi:hypothetical protein
MVTYKRKKEWQMRGFRQKGHGYQSPTCNDDIQNHPR